jgi:hypothetical protein
MRYSKKAKKKEPGKVSADTFAAWLLGLVWSNDNYRNLFGKWQGFGHKFFTRVIPVTFPEKEPYL